MPYCISFERLHLLRDGTTVAGARSFPSSERKRSRKFRKLWTFRGFSEYVRAMYSGGGPLEVTLSEGTDMVVASRARLRRFEEEGWANPESAPRLHQKHSRQRWTSCAGLSGRVLCGARRGSSWSRLVRLRPTGDMLATMGRPYPALPVEMPRGLLWRVRCPNPTGPQPIRRPFAPPRPHRTRPCRRSRMIIPQRGQTVID